MEIILSFRDFLYYLFFAAAMVRWRTTDILLDLWFLLHTGVSHRRTTELREEIFDTDRFARLRLCPFEGNCFPWTTNRWCLHLRSIPRWSSFQHEHDETWRIIAENFVRRRSLRKYVFLLLTYSYSDIFKIKSKRKQFWFLFDILSIC